MKPESNHSSQDAPRQPDTVDGIAFLNRKVEIACPRCQHQLSIGVLASEKIAGCRNCHGILVQTRVLASLVEFLRAGYDGEDANGSAIEDSLMHLACGCPACSGRMETHPYEGPGNVIIDSCINCGLVWLDPRELTQIIEAPGSREPIDDVMSVEERIVLAAQPIRQSSESDLALAVALSLMLG